MAVTITIKDENDEVDILTYTSIQLESAATVSGVYTLVATLLLVSGQTYYSFLDSAGSINTWYRYRYHNATGPVDSAYSNSFQPEGSTLLKIRQYAIQKYGAGNVYLATAGCTPSTVLTLDPDIDSTLYRSKRGRGTTIYGATGALAGQQRLVTDSNPSIGSISVSPVFSTQFADQDQFEWHWLVPATVWNSSINRGLRRYWYLDRVPIPGLNLPEIPLTYLPWLTRKNQVSGLWWYSQSTVVEEPYLGAGRWWNLRQDVDSLVLMTAPNILTTETVYLEAVRQCSQLATDASVAPSVTNLELIAALAWDEVLAFLTRPGNGSLTDRDAWAKERNTHATQELQNYLRLETPRPRVSLPIWDTPVTVPQPYRAR